MERFCSFSHARNIKNSRRWRIFVHVRLRENAAHVDLCGGVECGELIIIVFLDRHVELAVRIKLKTHKVIRCQLYNKLNELDRQTHT